MTQAEKVLDIVVIGGSLSGLIHGIVLKRLGHNVQILERGPSVLLAQEGAGLGVGGDLEAFMQEYDALQIPYMLEPPEAFVVDACGNLITTMKPGVRATSWNTLYYRLRANFDGLESDHCPRPPGRSRNDGITRYLYGQTVLSVGKEDVQLIVEYRCYDGNDGNIMADLVIAADGAGSNIRRMVAPQVKRKYAGYCAWRGTVLEHDMEHEIKSLCQGNDRHCQIERSFFLSYTIPGKDGCLDHERRLRNWVWYCNFEEDSEDHQNIMTDCDMKKHRFSLPRGKMREEVWKRQKRLAEKLLDPHSANLIHKTEEPFIQVVTEAISPQACFFDGKLLLVGDALATLRPLSGQGTNQAARSALLLKQVLTGSMDMQEWEQSCLQFAQVANDFGIKREKLAGLGLP